MKEPEWNDSMCEICEIQWCVRFEPVVRSADDEGELEVGGEFVRTIVDCVIQRNKHKQSLEQDVDWKNMDRKSEYVLLLSANRL